MTDRTALTWADLGETYDGPHATPRRVDKGPFFLNISSLSSGRLDLSQSDHVSDEEFVKWTRRVTPQENDLLFSYETRLGEAALMPGGVKACLGRRMALLRPDPEVVHPQFLLYYYLSPAFQRLIEQNTIHGATVNRISLSTMGKWPVDIPPIQSQKAIAEVLGSLDDKIAANTKLEKTVDELAAALTSQAISSGPELPLLELAEITMGSSPAGTSLNESGEGIVFYQGVRDFGVRYPERRIWTDAPVRFAEELDILFSVRAPVGRANIAPEKLCIGRGLASLRSRLGAPYTLFHAVKSSPIWQRFDSEGTVFGSINRKQLEAVTLKWVDSRELESLEADLASLENLLRTATSMKETLAAMRDALLPQLMSGKLRVKDAEKVVEDAL